MHRTRGQIPVEALLTGAYRFPTEQPEADGTLRWAATTLVLVRARAGGCEGLGYSYTHASAAQLIASTLAPLVRDCDALAVSSVWQRLVRATRNLGRPGIVSSALAAVDTALWDLKARLLELPLTRLLGQLHATAPAYGSGGFTNYGLEQLTAQLADWAAAGIPRVKLKVGADPAADLARVRAARAAVGPDAELMVDANGAYDRKQALAQAARFADYGVSWFEEPVSSDDLEGLRLLRDRAPPGMAITAGEYGYDLVYFRRMLEAGAVDVLQADVTRCAGISELLRVDALCQAHGVPLSAHTAPALHLHPCCALSSLRHIEYFHDHVRIERALFEGVDEPRDGGLRPNLERPGHGLRLREEVAAAHALAEPGAQ